MTPLQIKSPIWASSSVGIAERAMGNQGVDLEITYINKLGYRLYPNTYHISREKIAQYPTQKVGSNTILRIVPIKDLEIK